MKDGLWIEAPVTTKATVDAVQNPWRAIDAITNVDTVLRSGPQYAEMFTRLAEERKISDDRCPGEWKKVAELQVPHEMAARILEPDFLKDKRKFYAWLDRNPRYCAYDRRKRKQVSDRFFNFGGLNGTAPAD